MAIKADTRRLLDAVATLEFAAQKFERLADFTDEADQAAFRSEGLVIALDIREQVEFIENRLIELRKVADSIERKAKAGR